MAFLKLSEIIQGGQSCLPTFGHLFMLLSRVFKPKLVVLLFLCSEVKEKINALTLKTCHFKASRDITTNFRSGTLDNNINKWPKVGK